VLENADPVLQVTFFMLVSCQLILGVSRRGCNFLIQMVSYIIQLTLLRGGLSLSSRDQKLLADIPADSRACEEKFHLKSEYTIYAVCPNPDCHALYAPEYHDHLPMSIYPTTCTRKEFPQGSACGSQLLKPQHVNGVTILVPIKRFVAFSFKDWLAGLLSRPGFEDMMDDAWKQCKKSHGHGVKMKDIFEGDIIRNFLGPDGKHFSYGDKEGRYLFSLAVDYFNPLGNKAAGKPWSVGMVSLVCLNLPIELRYQAENMFLFGVIPGPKEPPLDCINHYLTPLVDVLQEFWSPGVRFSRTYKRFYGRVVRSAMVCVVCDLLAARKTIGFASHNHTQMCAMCHCTRKSHGLGNTDLHTWRRRTKQEFVASSELYLAADSTTRRNEVVKTTGVRWTVLLQLPYFDPSRFVVVDAMHNLFLGLIEEHFHILGIRLDEPADKEIDISDLITPASFSDLSAAEQKLMRRLIRLLEQPLHLPLDTPEGHQFYEKKIMTCQLNCLRRACELLGTNLELKYPNQKVHKIHYVQGIIAWVCTSPSLHS